MLGPLPELKPMARARMGYRCHGWRHLGRSTKRWRSAGIGSCRRTPLGGGPGVPVHCTPPTAVRRGRTVVTSIVKTIKVESFWISFYDKG